MLGALGILLSLVAASQEEPARPSVVLITADDLGCDSVGAFGCSLEEATPHLDALAAAGLRFEHAHVNIAICRPTRAVWMTGRYPHNSGALGFDPIRADVPTLVEALREAGYRTGIFGKTSHVVPTRAHAWHTVVKQQELQTGRSPELYAQHARAFFAERGRPFFLMVNLHDPHRPFAGSAQEDNRRKRVGSEAFPPVEDPYDPAEVPLPGFLPDLPEIRREIAEYFTSVRRADRVVGRVLDELAAAGLADDTLVIFLSDHGMALPFSKANCWRHSTRTPLIVRWPGVTETGGVDAEHLVSGVDLAPTILDAVGLPPLDGTEGESLVPILRGQRVEGRDHVFCMINTLSSKQSFSMRAVQDRRHGYIWNAWSDGERAYRNESMSGRTFQAMVRSAETDPAVAARVAHFRHRVPEELYDYESDPDARRNLVGDGDAADVLVRMRALLLSELERTRDPLLSEFRSFVAGVTR